MNPENDAEIATIYLGNGALDNDYTFYQSGAIKHLYDSHAFSLNNVEWLTTNQIDSHTRHRILERCPDNVREQVLAILLAENQ